MSELAQDPVRWVSVSGPQPAELWSWMESKSYQIIYMLDGAKIIMFDQADDAVMFRLAWL